MITGIFAQAVSFFSFVALLGVAELSFAVPATALGNVAKTLFAKIWLNEHVSWRRWDWNADDFSRRVPGFFVE